MNAIKVLIMSISLVTILNIVLNKNSNYLKKKIRWQHYLFGYFFIFYLMITLSLVGFPSLWEWQILLSYNRSIFNPHINLVPFKDGFDITYILNIILFMPLGILLPTLWEKYRNFRTTLFYGIFLSFAIEIGQLFVGLRATDINDIITNIMGSICGWIIFIIMRKVFRKLVNKTVVNISSSDILVIKLEPYIYVIIAVICTFF